MRGLCRLTSAQDSVHCVGIWSSVLSVWHSYHQIDHSMLWWMVVGANWLTMHQECHRAVFWTCYFSSGTLQSVFPFWRISWSVMPMIPNLGNPWTPTLARLMNGVMFWGWNWMQVTKTMIVTWSHTMHHQSPLLNMSRTVLKESDNFVKFEVIFNS